MIRCRTRSAVTLWAVCCLAFQANLTEGQSCSAAGSLHFMTFDGQALDFPYPCKYVFAKTCSRLAPVSFDIKIKTMSDIGRGGAVSIEYVEVTTEGKTVQLLPSGLIVSDGLLVNSYEHKCKFKIQRVPRGIEMAMLSANITLTVTESGFVMIRVPESFRSFMCGLCGNYDGDASNDFSNRLNSDWFIPDLTDRNCASPPTHGFTSNAPCSKAEKSSCNRFNSTNTQRFASCAKSYGKLVNSFYQFCLDDVCASCPDDAEGSACAPDEPDSCYCAANEGNGVACRLAEALAAQCSERGVPSPETIGENEETCSNTLTCPEGSSYTRNSTSCIKSCKDNRFSECSPSLACSRPIYTDRCECPSETFWNGSACVKQNICGCTYGAGLLYPVGSRWIDSTCSAEIECLPNGQLQATLIECAEHSDCLLVDKVRKCNCKAGYEGDGRSECKLVCSPGERVASTNDTCESCPIGTYQPDTTTTTSCIACPDGLLTPTVGSITQLECTVSHVIPMDNMTYLACKSSNCVKQVFVPAAVLPNGVTINGATHRSVWVSSNGVINFDGLFIGQIPSSLLQVRSKVIAPYWFHQDLSYGNSSFTIGEYSRISGKEKLALIEMFLRSSDKAGSPSITILWAMIVTWTSAMPYPRERYSSSENVTYQLILASDGLTTLAAFIYPRNGLHVQSREVLKEIQMGYNLGNNLAYRFYGSGSDIMAKLDEIDSNIGVPGRWIFVVSQISSPAETKSCIKWYANETETWRVNKPSSLNCPCDSIAAAADRNFQMNTSTWCAVSIYPSSKYNMYQMCCYERSSSSRYRRLITDPKKAGRPIYHNPNRAGDRNKYLTVDEKPFLDCCSRTDNCHLYRQYRPADNCLAYRSPTSGGGAGDPHFVSLDGLKFTYNAIGEFHLLKSPFMRVQSRLGRFLNFGATDFKALACQAMQPLSSRVHVELNGDRSGLLIHVKAAKSNSDRDETLNYSETIEKVQEYEEVTVSGTTKRLKIIFQNGYVIEIEVISGMIQQSVFVPPSEKNNSVSGLLGNFDGNPQNDLLFPNGTVVNCQSDSQCIHNFFGQAWRINKNESLFWYRDKLDTASYTNYSFVPIIPGSGYALTNDIDFCGENEQCKFDFIATGDRIIAMSTKVFMQEITTTSETLARVRPTIQPAMETINARANSPVILRLDITSASPKHTELKALSSPTYATLTNFNDTVYIFNWTPTRSVGSPSGLPLRFIAIDSTTASFSPILTINVAFCDCDNGGSCIWPDRMDVIEFVTVSCNCSEGWTGTTCSENFDACKERPCGGGGVCQDELPGRKTEYECLCRSGYYLSSDELTCLDIDECNNTSDKCGIREFCVNTAGTYSCDCLSGFARSSGSPTCEDIDECAVGLLNQCQHVCHNQIGGYSCSCFAGYTLQGPFQCANQNGTVPNCQNLNCTDSCVIDGTGIGSCRCLKGFNLLSNGSCADKNECVAQPCGANASCRNTDGSFECLCDAGFKLSTDKITCDDCPAGNYGVNCSQSCNCAARARSCDQVRGCLDCTAGWTGDQCRDDIDECRSAIACNGLGFTCINTAGSYVCQCSSGYEPVAASRDCIDVDECSKVPAPCKAGFQCDNTVGSFTCDTCVEGYERQGNSCLDIDECLKNNTCFFNAECTNMIGGYECRCPQGYYGDGRVKQEGSGCEDVNECSAQPGPCPVGSNCINNDGSYDCVCPSGLEAVGECCISSFLKEDCRAKSTRSNCSSAGICCLPSGQPLCKCERGDGTDFAADVVCLPDEKIKDSTSSKPDITTTSSTADFIIEMQHILSINQSKPNDVLAKAYLEKALYILYRYELIDGFLTLKDLLVKSKPEPIGSNDGQNGDKIFYNVSYKVKFMGMAEKINETIFQISAAILVFDASFKVDNVTITFEGPLRFSKDGLTFTEVTCDTLKTACQIGSCVTDRHNLPKWECVDGLNSCKCNNTETFPKSDDPPVSDYLPLWITAGVLGGILVFAVITVLAVFLIRKHRRVINLHRQDSSQRPTRADSPTLRAYLNGVFRPFSRHSARRRSNSTSTSTASSNSSESYHNSPEGRVGMSVPFGPRWPIAYGRIPARPASHFNAAADEEDDD